MKTTYEVVAEYHKPWFKSGRVVFKLFKNYEYWDDPTYGNGGGDYRPAKQLIEIFPTEKEATDIMKILNKDFTN